MCGIAGIVAANGGVDQDVLQRMSRHLRHRGPDAEGYFITQQVGLGHRRLSIIDLGSGEQPMTNENGTIWIVFNGEIYNFQELRARLEGLGHSFRTKSDTEVIVHAYEQYGTGCVHHFRGMFAFAIADTSRHVLFLARDRVGKKPLYYAFAGDQFVFASELQGLFQHPRLMRRPSFPAIDDYLTYGYVPGPQTAFHGVHKLPPAHTLLYHWGDEKGTARELRIDRYWELAYHPKEQLSLEDAAEKLLDVLSEAVRLRMIADVPLGALLSGGIDSSLVVALMARLTNRPIKTFSIGFDEPEFDELPFARTVSSCFGTEHHVLVVRPNALEILPTLVRHYGEPFADSSAVPSYYVASITRQHVTVALNGDGGDESFGGYDRYLGSRLADRVHRLPKVFLHGLSCLADRVVSDSLPQRSRWRQTKRLLQAAGLPTGPRYLHWMSFLSPTQKQSLYRPEFGEALGAYDAQRWLLDEYEAIHARVKGVDALMALDVRSYLPYDLLVKVDIATMACSLEARSPLLDHKVMEFAAAQPAPYKIRRTVSKYLLKKAASQLLPSEILRRRKKGFGVPIAIWLRNDLRPLLEDTLLSSSALTAAYFDQGVLRDMVGQHASTKRDHSSALWALLWLELWHREFFS